MRAAFDAGDLQTAAQLAFEHYGRDVLSFLSARLRSHDDGQEAFSMFTEDLWNGIANFSWRCSMRCWLYILARNAANRYAASPHRGRARNLPLSQYAFALAAEQTLRTPTLPYRATELKQRIRALRERLDPDDQLVLILHVDRGLSWSELALVMSACPESLAGPALAREAARLRKRFQRIKAELRKIAIEEGLLTR